MMNSRNSKSKIVFGISILLLLGFCLLSSSAFFAKSITANNIVSFGNLKLQLINNTIDETGKEIAVTEEKEKIDEPKVSRIIKVKNVCDNSMYVRVKIELTGECGQTGFMADPYVNYDFNDGEWKKQGEWFYYLEELRPKEVTGNLIEKFEFDTNRLTGDFAGSTIVLKVSAQAVQSEHNGNSLEAQGWPEEE